MTRITTVFALLVGSTVIPALAQRGAPEVVAERSYEFKPGYKVEGVGVCKVTDEVVDCWNLDGARDPDLTERIRAHFIAGSNRDIQLRFGKKNRFVVLRSSRNDFSFQALSPTGDYFPSIYMDNAQGDPRFVMVRTSSEREDKTAELLIRASGIEPAEVADVPFRKGSKAKVGEVTVEIGEWKAVKEPQWLRYGYPGAFAKNSSYWNVIIGYQPSTSGFGYSGFTVLDKQGGQIHYVDHKGKPVSSAEYLATSTRPPDQPYGPPTNPKYSPLVFQASSMGMVQGATEFLTNVDPAHIGSLRSITASSASVLLTGFPLDPKE